MFHLDLQPDPLLILAQSGIFFVNIYLINSLWLKPYLKLKAERNRRTSEALAQAQDLLAQCTKKREALLSTLQEARLKARREAQTIVDKAEKESKHQLEKARQEALVELDEIRSQIHQLREAEASKIPVYVDKLVLDISKRLAG